MRSVAAIVVFTTLAGVPPTAAPAQSAWSAAAVQADFAALWRDVNENYAYFDSRVTGWASVPALYKSDLARVKTRAGLIAVLERVLDELHDAHAQLTANTADSPRLVPSGTDIWAEWQSGRAIVAEIREGSDAQRSGMRAGAEVLAIDSVPIDRAVRARIGRSIPAIDDAVRSWSVRAVLAGRHNQPRRIQFKTGETVSIAGLPAEDQNVKRDMRLTVRELPGNIGYIRLHDSLGDQGLIGEFDSALARFERTAGLILDLRDTPSGGNTTIARAILGRFTRTEQPYQKHVLPTEERETGVRRSWLELVTPRGPSAYQRHAAVLVGHWTGSMGEGLAIGFDAINAATIVGTPMARLLGATSRFELPQSHIGVNLPVERLFHVNGTPRETFVPKVPVTLADLNQSGSDPWIAKAIQVLAKR